MLYLQIYIRKRNSINRKNKINSSKHKENTRKRYSRNGTKNDGRQKRNSETSRRVGKANLFLLSAKTNLYINKKKEEIKKYKEKNKSSLLKLNTILTDYFNIYHNFYVNATNMAVLE